MKKLTTEEFIEKAKEVHGDKYDYSKVNYTNKRTKVEIICPTHGSFFQLPESHYRNGSGCPKCAITKKSENRKFSNEEIIKQFKKTHGNTYDYSKINYVNIDTPVEIICPTHGSFFQSPYEHKKGANCPKCYNKEKTIKKEKHDYPKTETVYPNKGEERIRLFLQEKKVSFEEQKSFLDCKSEELLPFDFYIPTRNLLIDYDKTKKEHNEIKEKYCEENNLKFVKISHQDFNNIEKILSKHISSTFINTWPKDFDKEAYAKNILNNLGDFPYDDYPKAELINDFKKIICAPRALGGMKIVRHFHHNIYSSKVGNGRTAVEAWKDKELLYKIILNRMIYRKPPYTAKVIRDGLNITKKAPKVSVFKPSLAAYLTSKYLNEYDTVFDPFSGFSGRMLGVCALGKKYIGQDLSFEQVECSNKIINYFNLNAEVSQKDAINSGGEYDCLLTCSPYNLKETWGDKIEDKTCDEWIDICLKNFKCKKYVFVVDKTEKYKDFIKEEIENKSHFGSNKEYVVVYEQ